MLLVCCTARRQGSVPTRSPSRPPTAFHLRLSMRLCPYTGPLPSPPRRFPTAFYQEAYGPVPISTSGGSGSFTWSSTGLPNGVTVNAAGVVGGIANAIGTFTPTISLLDSITGQTATHTYSLTVGFAPLSMTAPSLPNGTLKVRYSVSLVSSAVGGDPPYQWSIQAGSLPPGNPAQHYGHPVRHAHPRRHVFVHGAGNRRSRWNGLGRHHAADQSAAHNHHLDAALRHHLRDLPAADSHRHRRRRALHFQRSSPGSCPTV